MICLKRLIVLSYLSVSRFLFFSVVCAAVGGGGGSATGEYEWIRNISPNYVTDSQQFLGHVVVTYDNAYIVTQCARRCLTTSNCASYNFLYEKKRCEINSDSHQNYPKDLVPSNGSQYYLRDAYSIDTTALGPCSGNTCNNGGTCLTSISSNGVLSFYCYCLKGWTGSTCSDQGNMTVWSDWSDWSICSTTCGDGVQSRTRNCVNTQTGTKQSTDLCDGRSTDESYCRIQNCPYWSVWSDWGSCATATGCGLGNKLRTRTCTNGGKMGIDRLCMGPNNETTPCQLTACNAPVRLQRGTSYGEGRVDVYDDVTAQWLSVCYDGWTQQDGDVVCRQMGLRTGASNVESYDIKGTVNVSVFGFQCSGSEQTLASCSLQQWYGSSCPSGVYAGVSCTVNGQWSKWSDWRACSVSCASGISVRTRECSSPPTLRGGEDCVGDASQTQPCDLPPCPINAVWGNWQDWGQCSLSCGNGTQSRNRICTSGEYGGQNCTGSSIDTQSCNSQPCPVDGVYIDWSDWAACSTTCGNGTQTRYRNCTEPLYGGNPCEGDSNQTQSCFDTYCPVDGFWGQWSPWGQCNATCGGGTALRNRTCIAPLYGGEWCNGSATDVLMCNTQSCAVDGVWNTWSSWSSCNATCGSGTMIRIRNCNGPFYGGLPCPGSTQDDQFCNDNPCPVNGQWSAWSRWADCSVSCGPGVQTSYRICSNVLNGGKVCPGSANQQQNCDDGPCPIDCVWNSWSDWTSCNATCGGGMSWRSRSFTPEQNNGAECNGTAQEDASCNENECPIPGNWSDWSPWTMCSLTCGPGGVRTRNRTCNMTTYGDLTLPCLPLGGDTNTKVCNDFSCNPLALSCVGWYSRGLEDNSSYVAINPDQSGVNPPFNVYCNRNGTDIITTVHNTFETELPYQGSPSTAGSRVLGVQYVDGSGNKITVDQLTPMVDNSNLCKQFISWRCYSSPINSYSAMSVKPLVYWNNRVDGLMGYWGDVTPISFLTSTSGMTCSCGATQACGKPGLKCFCDNNDATWRSDDGYLTGSSNLPVMNFVFTDSGNAASKGYYEVGPLVCWN